MTPDARAALARSHEMPDVPVLKGCPCFGSDYAGACICGPTEKALRAKFYPFWHTAKLTNEQRVWCLEQLRSVEGWSDRLSEYQDAPDDKLAQAVLFAWQDYCRDKGLL